MKQPSSSLWHLYLSTQFCTSYSTLTSHLIFFFFSKLLRTPSPLFFSFSFLLHKALTMTLQKTIVLSGSLYISMAATTAGFPSNKENIGFCTLCFSYCVCKLTHPCKTHWLTSPTDVARRETIFSCGTATTLWLLISMMRWPTRTPPLSAIPPRSKLQIWNNTTRIDKYTSCCEHVTQLYIFLLHMV